jgi:DNA-directed RNA polymerase specialized sigma24 family protein
MSRQNAWAGLLAPNAMFPANSIWQLGTKALQCHPPGKKKQPIRPRADFGVAVGQGLQSPRKNHAATGVKLVPESTTFWILQLKEGNRDAAQHIWERYYFRLVDAVRRRLNGRHSLAASDEFDVAQSAFASFYDAAERGRFPQLSDSNDLWRLLITITQRKITRRLRYQGALMRNPLNGTLASSDEVDLDSLPSNEPTPDFCVAAVESFSELMRKLTGPNHRSIALMRMEGYTNEEIASQVKCSLSTIERKLRLIRHEWSTALEERGR